MSETTSPAAPTGAETTGTGVHPSAVGSGTKPQTTTAGTQNTAGTTERPDATSSRENTSGGGSSEETYPEQRHAGQVGLGPAYGQGAGLGDKIVGTKEELLGKMKHNPDLIQRGHDRKTGELKHKEQEEADPFTSPQDKEADAGKEQAGTVAPEGTQAAEGQKGEQGASTKTI